MRQTCLTLCKNSVALKSDNWFIINRVRLKLHFTKWKSDALFVESVTSLPKLPRGIGPLGDCPWTTFIGRSKFHFLAVPTKASFYSGHWRGHKKIVKRNFLCTFTLSFPVRVHLLNTNRLGGSRALKTGKLRRFMWWHSSPSNLQVQYTHPPSNYYTKFYPRNNFREGNSTLWTLVKTMEHQLGWMSMSKPILMEDCQ